MIGELPKALEVNGKWYAIRSDFRDVLKILTAFSDPDLEDGEKVYICLCILFKDSDRIPEKDLEKAFLAAVRFINHDSEDEEDTQKKQPRVMDWEQDEAMLFPAVNKVAGYETRAAKYIHWWTFLGYYMEISDGVYSHVLSLRMKKARGKKLEKWEQEFWNQNKKICKLKQKLSEEEKAERERLNALLG